MCAAGASSEFYNATTVHTITGDHVLLPNLAQDLATFLLLRGDYAFLGTGWSGCGKPASFPDEFKADYGTPTGLCAETAPNSGIYSRDFTLATVSMDCNTYTPSITLKG
jgi:hypothetical protein